MDNTKEKFRNYLLERYTQNSANSYMSGLNHVSKDYGSDIFQVSDPEAVQKIRSQYDIGGSKRKIGDYGNGSARNAVIQYHNFIESGTDNTQSSENTNVELELETTNRRFTYERDLHNTLESQAKELFPDYELVGSEYSIETVRLDLLLEKERELLVVELKAGVATYEVFGQISMYMGLVKEKFPEREVHGVIIASEIHKGLKAACSTNNDVACKKYCMKLNIESA